MNVIGSINANFLNWWTLATDSESEEDVVKIRRHSLARRRNFYQSSDDESTDEEEQRRKTFYKEHGSDEDDEEPIDEQAYSRATRLSINGFQPRKSVTPVGTNSGDESDVIIIEESEAEDLVAQAAPGDSIAGDSVHVSSSGSFMAAINKEMSSTLLHRNEAVGWMELVKVSPSQYSKKISKVESAERQVREMLKFLKNANSLPDRGQMIQAGWIFNCR